MKTNHITVRPTAHLFKSVRTKRSDTINELTTPVSPRA